MIIYNLTSSDSVIHPTFSSIWPSQRRKRFFASALNIKKKINTILVGLKNKMQFKALVKVFRS